MRWADTTDYPHMCPSRFISHVEGDVVPIERVLCTDATPFAGKGKPAAAASAEVVVVSRGVVESFFIR